MRWLPLALVVVLVAACGPYYDVVRGPDGRMWKVAHCDDEVGCFKEAASICSGGYDILDKAGHRTGHASGSLAGEWTGSMLYRCKGE